MTIHAVNGCEQSSVLQQGKDVYLDDMLDSSKTTIRACRLQPFQLSDAVCLVD